MPPAELARLYDAHAAGLYRLLLRMAGSEADARDLLQDVFVKLARQEVGKSCGHERGYLFCLARNLAIDWLRRRQTAARIDDRLRAETLEMNHHDHTGERDDERLAAALDALPVEQRVVVHLRIWEEMTFEELGRALGIPVNTAASRYRYALEKLRAHLAPLPAKPA